MPQVLTKSDIDHYRKTIEQKGKAGVDQFYAGLRKKGYPTGHWGASEYNPNSYYGIVTQHYLEKHTGRPLDAKTRDRLYRQTAEHTLEAFEQKIKNGDGQTTEDLEYKEASDAHKAVYKKNHLDSDWVFDIPIEIKRTLTGDAAAESAYQKAMREGVPAAPTISREETRKLMNMGKAAWPLGSQIMNDDLNTVAIDIGAYTASVMNSNSAQHKAFSAFYQDIDNISGQKNISREKFLGQLDKFKQYDGTLPEWAQQLILPMRKNTWNSFANTLPTQDEVNARQSKRYGQSAFESSRLWLDAVLNPIEARWSAFGHSPLGKTTMGAAQWALLFNGFGALVKAATKFPIAAEIFLKSPNWKTLAGLGKDAGITATAVPLYS